jgi:hypothetical protein
MANSESILKSWGLLRSYQSHKHELYDLALRYYGTLRYMNRGLPAITVDLYHRTFARFLEHHPLFAIKMVRRKLYIPPHMYQALSEHLAWHIIEQHWDDIVNYPY